MGAKLRLPRRHSTQRCSIWLLRQRQTAKILPIAERHHSNRGALRRLLEAHCLPVLSYGIEVIHVTDRDDRRQMRVAYNAIYRKLFGYSYRESVTLLQHTLGRMTWEEFADDRRASFLRRCRQCPPDALVNAFG